MSGIIFYLCQNLSILKRATEEVRAAFDKAEDIKIGSISNLTYLNAVIEETLRMYPPFVTSLARVPPDSGAYVDGNWVPKNVRS